METDSDIASFYIAASIFVGLRTRVLCNFSKQLFVQQVCEPALMSFKPGRNGVGCMWLSDASCSSMAMYQETVENTVCCPLPLSLDLSGVSLSFLGMPV